MQTLKSKLFWTASIIAAAIIFTVLYNANKTYVGESRILILPENTMTAGNIEQIIGNAQEIPKSLSFYNGMLAENHDIVDGAANLPDVQRKNYWDSKIDIRRIGHSSILDISVFDKNPVQADIITQQAANDIAVVMSHYYNIQTDLSVRIIEEPIVSLTQKGDFWTSSIAISSILGLVLGAAIVNIIFSIQKKRGIISRKEFGSIFEPEEAGKKFEPEPEAEEIIQSDISETIRPVPAEDEKKVILEKLETKEKKIGKKPSQPVAREKKSVAPSNLPIGEGPMLEGAVSFAPGEGKEVKADHLREATPEEVKERLNKLLKGNL